MKFKLPLIAVQDVERSKKFYSELFAQKVTADFGENVTFSGGFAIQQNFAWLTELAPESVLTKAHNMELYFEVDDFTAFCEQLDAYPDIEYVHQPKQHDWQQWVVRIYDPDGHIIEIGEDMNVVVKRLLQEGRSLNETAQITQYPLSFVKRVAKNLNKEEQK